MLRAMSIGTFTVQQPPIAGSHIREWQETLQATFRHWGVDYPLELNGVYDVATRSATASVLHGLGIAQTAMLHGVTPELRTKVRHKRLSVAERARYVARAGWRRALADRYRHASVSSPLAKILQDSWGYHPGVHDGLDLICNPNAPLLAICTGRVLRADDSGWWGLGAPTDPKLRARGDGIIVIECETDVGPFKSGLRFCYGHAEHPRVKVGQQVHAGEVLGLAGFANAWHIHLMVTGRADAKGVGDRDPRPYVDYARSH